MSIAWVVGQHGLLGSALVRKLSTQSVLHQVPFRFDWGDTVALQTQLQRAVAGFAEASRGAADWSIYWAAGVGTMQSDASVLATETLALGFLLAQIEAEPALAACPGRLAFASSAGAIYAGAGDLMISETTEVAPTTDYARAKLQQERLLSEHAGRQANRSLLVARLSTLYGCGQAAGKAQGLLTHMSRQVIRGLPVRIFVPLDTIRDYLEVDDAASAMIAMCRTVPSGSTVVKIIASEQPTTISEIVGVFRKVSRRPPKIITSMGRASALYTRRIQFRSILQPDLRKVYRTNLVIGIASLLEAERLRYAAVG